jgi:hypothetical protein
MNAHSRTVVLAIVLVAACGRAKTQNTGGQPVGGAGGGDASKTIEAVLAVHNDSLLAVPGVLGTAIGRCSGAPCIRILVSRVTDEVQRRIPSNLEGFAVQIDVTGPIVPR